MQCHETAMIGMDRARWNVADEMEGATAPATATALLTWTASAVLK